jgi:ABC-2 type transport system ATP-binding protein
MLQRVGLAQALIHQPRLLILDEPTAGVDPVGSRRIRDLILELKRHGITILVTSHLLEQIQEVCDRVGIMSNGRMVREGPLQELITVETQTQLLIENASPELLGEIRRLIETRGGGTHLVSMGRRNTTLEKLFHESTTQTEDS